MELKKLIDAANAAYPDDLIRRYEEGRTGNLGDTLAKFILLELEETFDPDATDEKQVETAARAMETAEGELAKVRKAIEALRPMQNGKETGHDDCS